jgi:hypothetical protein
MLHIDTRQIKMDKEEIVDLLDRYLKGLATPEEEEKLAYLIGLQMLIQKRLQIS